MAKNTDIGKIDKAVLYKTYEEAHIEWKIPDFLTIINKAASRYDFYESPAFIIDGVSWRTRLYPFPDPKFIDLVISTDVKRDYTVQYDLSLKKIDGDVEQKAAGIIEKDNISSGLVKLIKPSELQQRKSELLSQNLLTIICRLKREMTNFTESVDKSVPLKLIKLDKLSENFKNLFGNKETCDTTLKVKDKEYKAHKSVLVARSSVFAATFKHDTLEKQTGVITITDCDPDSFQEFLEYLYCGKLEGISYQSALSLYYTSDKYDVEELKEFCVEYLMQCLTVENMCDIAVFADKFDQKALFSSVQDFFNRNVSGILVTSEWKRLLKNHSLLANDLLIAMPKVEYKE